jgi:hypothetical protein
MRKVEGRKPDSIKSDNKKQNNPEANVYVYRTFYACTLLHAIQANLSDFSERPVIRTAFITFVKRNTDEPKTGYKA